MAFERFIKGTHKTRRSEGSFATVSKDSIRITFNYPLTDWLASKGIKNVDFLFDSKEKKIAFKSAGHQAYCIQHRQRSQAYVSAKLFLAFLALKEGRYKAYVGEDEDMIVVDIRRPISFKGTVC